MTAQDDRFERGLISQVMHGFARRLAWAIAAADLRLWLRMGVVTVVMAGLAGMVAALRERLGWSVFGPGLGAALGAILISTVTGLGLYLALWRRDRVLFGALAALSRDHVELLAVLGTLTQLRGGDTAGHNIRVTLYALMFSRSLGWPAAQTARLAKGALLHDIGKLAVPDAILEKPGPLTAPERARMADHVRLGVEVVAQSEFLADARPVVAAHHERFDGGGYPHGLAGEAIPLEARAFALLDVFDALISPRVYKAALPVDQALATMAAERGSHFDPELFDRFAAIAAELAARVPSDEKAAGRLLVRMVRPYLDRFLLGVVLPDPPARPIPRGMQTKFTSSPK